MITKEELIKRGKELAEESSNAKWVVAQRAVNKSGYNDGYTQAVEDLWEVVEALDYTCNNNDRILHNKINQGHDPACSLCSGRQALSNLEAKVRGDK